MMDAREAARTARKQRAHMEARAMDAGQRIIVARDTEAFGAVHVAKYATTDVAVSVTEPVCDTQRAAPNVMGPGA